MTELEETAFRAAAREALGRSNEIVMVALVDPAQGVVFSLVTFDHSQTVGIVIPQAWENEDGAEDWCQAILRQESMALAGRPLD